MLEATAYRKVADDSLSELSAKIVCLGHAFHIASNLSQYLTIALDCLRHRDCTCHHR